MRKTLDLWILIFIIVALVSVFDAARSGITALRSSLPFALEFLRSSVAILLSITGFIAVYWAIRRRKHMKEHLHEVLQRLGWVLLGWAAVGWWSVAADSSALPASLYFFPVMGAASVLISVRQKGQAASKP